MDPNYLRHGFPNPCPSRAETERANVYTAPYTNVAGPSLNPTSMNPIHAGMPQPPLHSPNSHPHQLAVPPRRAPSGRLANRHHGITVNQDAFTQPPAQVAPGGPPSFPFSPPDQNMPSSAQANAYTQRPVSYPPRGETFSHAPPPIPSNQPWERRQHDTNESADQFPSMAPLEDALPQPAPTHGSEPPPRPEYLIIGLFALRITWRLIRQLDTYPGSDADHRWLEDFLQPYHPSYALAKLKDPRIIEEYVQVYPSLVRRMIKQPRYRRVFMDMNPEKQPTKGELSDEELRAVIDFVDAAGEWGSVVPVSGRYAQRMEDLAKRRRMAG